MRDSQTFIHFVEDRYEKWRDYSASSRFTNIRLDKKVVKGFDNVWVEARLNEKGGSAAISVSWRLASGKKIGECVKTPSLIDETFWDKFTHNGSRAIHTAVIVPYKD